MSLFRQLIVTMAHVHNASILHRDEKPENILFDANHNPVICDWGLAIYPGCARLTEIGYQVGTKGYTFPEPNPTVKQDIYALGVILLELLTGNREIHYLNQVKETVDRDLIHQMLTGSFSSVEEIWHVIAPKARQKAATTYHIVHSNIDTNGTFAILVIFLPRKLIRI